jgi:hypothetical protein
MIEILVWPWLYSHSNKGNLTSAYQILPQKVPSHVLEDNYLAQKFDMKLTCDLLVIVTCWCL